MLSLITVDAFAAGLAAGAVAAVATISVVAYPYAAIAMRQRHELALEEQRTTRALVGETDRDMKERPPGAV